MHPSVRQVVVLKRGAPAWVTPGAKMDADFANGRFYYNGRTYADETTFLSAIGGTKSGITRTIGPYLDPTNTNILTNGDFASDTTGWAAGLAGTTLGWDSSGKALLTAAAGSFPNVTQTLSSSSLRGRCFLLTGTGQRGTSVQNGQLILGVQAATAGGYVPSATTFNSTSPVTTSGLVSIFNTSVYVGGRISSAVAAGTFLFDDFSMVEAWPFFGWTHNSFSWAITARTGPSISGDEVLAQGDCMSPASPSTSEKTRIYRKASDKHVWVEINSVIGTQAALDMGVVNDDTDLGIAITCSGTSISASLNGGAPVNDASAIITGCGIFRIGRSFSGETWTGTIGRVTVL